ncbi:MAG: MSHA biogenesis protein MshQ [Shewanella sp.]|jgi:MSHA biogenesis protein MshQ
MRVQKGNGSSATSSTAINDDNWHHVVLTRNTSSGVVQVYVDGNLEDSANSTTGDVGRSYSSIGRIENSFSNLNFIGQLDELLIFDSVISASYVSSIYNNQLNGNNYDGTARICPANPIDHFEIQHDGNGFTCEAETVTIRACANEDCSIPYTEPVSISLSPSGWYGGDTIIFGNPQGEITTTLSVTEETTITLTKSSATPNADLRCFRGATETCDINFVNDGFEFFGSTTAIKILGDQEAETNFSNVNIRAVRDDEGVCKALLKDSKDIIFTYNCEEPATCLTPLAGIPLNGVPSGDQSGTLNVIFAADGTASLSMLNYADAGKLALTVAAEIGDVSVTSGTASVEVYPTNLKLDVSPISLLDDSSNYTAGEPFNFTIGAYGALGSLLKNYQADASELKVKRVAPNSIAANDGNFKYGFASASAISTNLAATFTATSQLAFNDGIYSSDVAYYDEVGRIEIDIQDANYLGNLIPSQGALTLGNFIPAYFTVAQIQPTLQNTHEDTFSYIGETIEFVTGSEPLLIFTAKNVQNAVTENYGVTPWILSLSQLDVNNGIFLIDSSTYAKTDSAEEVSKGSTPIISTGNLDYDGIIEVQIPDTRFKYNKVRSDNTTFDIASPFTALIDMEFSSTFLTDTDDVCYQADYASGTCLPFTITSITGANMRYGRLALESTYGPETEPLKVPIKAEYYDTGRWLLNTDDSGTSIAFNQSTDHIKLLASGSADITSDINNISSTGSLLLGVADDSNDLLLNAPGDMGVVKLQLNPSNDPTGWSDYLNYDWNGDGVIDSDDHPEATVTFGQFRGNDRIIHWREVFN